MNQPAVTSNARQVAVDLLGHGRVVRERAHALTIKHGALLQTKAKGRASGRPGPRVITGDFRRRIQRQTVRHVHVTTTYVGTDHPAGRRLQLGFHGRDALGRWYNQPPYPWLFEALEDVEDGYVEELGDLVAGP